MRKKRPVEIPPDSRGDTNHDATETQIIFYYKTTNIKTFNKNSGFEHQYSTVESSYWHCLQYYCPALTKNYAATNFDFDLFSILYPIYEYIFFLSNEYKQRLK